MKYSDGSDMARDAGDDGWTHVPRSKKTRKPQAITKGVPPPSRELSIEDITKDFNAKLKTWRSSECRASLIRMIDRVRPSPGWQLSTAICLGSGSLSRDNVECRRRSTWQMAVFLDVAEILGVNKGIFAQDPAFTKLDQEFLQISGVTVLPTATTAAPNQAEPGLGPARDVLRDTTFLFEPFVDMNAAMVNDMLVQGVGLYIGSSIKGLIEKGARAAASKDTQTRQQGDVEAGHLAKRFFESREMYTFPSFESDPNVFDGLGVYWVPEKDEDEG